ncbi:MAG: hypothetical protein L0Y44_12460, partial [Phycisphaerales bacterium]|nr:hypothetical protein [Phycisphaerales bacterium]
GTRGFNPLASRVGIWDAKARACGDAVRLGPTPCTAWALGEGEGARSCKQREMRRRQMGSV